MTLLREQIQRRERLAGAAVGSGMSALAAEEGGADLIMVLSAGYFRLQGISSAAAMLPYANANDVTWEIVSRHVVPRLKKTPVIMGVCAQDPGLDLPARLDAALLTVLSVEGVVRAARLHGLGQGLA